MTLNADIHVDIVTAPGSSDSGALPYSQRLVYLLSRYPAVSHTFFLNEIRELRKLGFSIDVASINPPDRDRTRMPEEEAREAERTLYIKSTGMLKALWIACGTLLLHPGVFLRGLRAALGLDRTNLRATVFALFYFGEAMVLGNWMRQNKQKHLHIHFCGPVATVGMIACLAWRFTYSLTVHGPDEFFDTEKFYLREKIENARFVFCISEFCRSQLMRIASPEHWKKMQVVRLGVDPSVFNAAHRKKTHNEMLEIICVGRLVPAKGQLILLQAAARLESQGSPVRVRLVGDGPDRAHLEAFTVEKHLCVIFEGAKNHEEVRHLLESADIFALASFAEGVPVALMEAMAMEIPCVSTIIAGIPELIRDGLDGLLVPASSSEALADALKSLINDSNLRDSIGAAGARHVNDRYNLRNNIQTLAAALNEQLSDIS